MATYRALISICHIYILLCRLLISKSRFLHLFHSSNHAGNCIFPQLQTGADKQQNSIDYRWRDRYRQRDRKEITRQRREHRD